jgi:iron complex transport system substrate-binding protein
VAPIGAASWWAENAEWPWLPHLRGQTELTSTQSVGTSDAPNLEQIAVLAPDLILGMEIEGHGEIYDQLSRIAPTVIIANTYPQITPGLVQIGAAVGREPRAAGLVAEYEQAAAEIRQAIATRSDIGAVSVFRFVDEGFQTQAPDRWVGQVLADAGVPRPESQQQASQTVSLERVDLIDGDVLIVFDATTEDQAQTRARIMDNPLFAQLKAVQNDAVYVVPYYWNSSGFLWARLLQNDLRTIFVEGQALP